MSIKEKDSAAEQPSVLMDERVAFEEWARRTHRRPGTSFDRAHNGTYKDNRIAAKWAAWQACVTAHLARQPPAPDTSWLLRSLVADLLHLLPITFEFAEGDRVIGRAVITKIRSILAAPAQEVEPGSAPAAADEVRDAVLEEAAKVCETEDQKYEIGRHCAVAIRALKTTASAATSENF